MTSALLAAVLLVCAVVTHDYGVAAVEALDTSSEDADVDDDGEGDFAPFVIVVEHVDGWRCAGSLVSLRTALTSAWCVRGRGALAARELWALAAGAAGLEPASEEAVAARLHGARRVARVAVATGADAEVSDGTDASPASWRGGAMDLAVIELESPFGSAAHTRPILMATAGGECDGAGGPGGADAQCHVSRALGQATERGARLRIVSADLAPPDRCARAANHWSAVRDRALCFVGPELCASDWGGGVVCGGKLCGVLSRSVRAGGGGGGSGNSVADDDCGDTHAAQSVSLWRRFLHCAHTMRACGRGGDCVDLCVERRLLDEPTTAAPASEAAPAPSAPHAATQRRPPTTTTTTISVFYYPTRTHKPHVAAAARTYEHSPTRSTTGSGRASLTHAPLLARTRRPATAPTALPAAPAAPAPLPVAVAAGDVPPSPRPSFEFEPNRADFKAPSRSTRAYLKAGEYGDNAADYGSEEAAAGAAAPTRSEPPSAPPGVRARTLPPGAAPPDPPGPLARPDALAPPPAERRAAPQAKRAGAARPYVLTVLMLLPFIYIFLAI